MENTSISRLKGNKMKVGENIEVFDVNLATDTSERTKTDGIGYWGAVAHLIRATVVTGILLLPYVMKTLGYITGTVVLIIVFIVYYHNLHILLDLDSHVRRHLVLPRLTYAIIANEIFSKSPFPFCKFRKFVIFLIYLYYILPTSKSISLILISKNIQQIAQYYDINLNPTVTVTALAVLLTVICMNRSLLKILVPFSSTTNIFTFIIAAVIVIYSIRYRDVDAIVYPFEGDNSSMLIIRGMVIYLNSVLCAYIVVPLRNEMKEPENLDGVLGGMNVTAMIIIIFYYAFSLIPYLCYGTAIQENIFSNIPVNDVLSLGINIIFSAALFVAYILAFYAYFDVIWSSKLQMKLTNSKYKCTVEYFIRIICNVMAYLMAVFIRDMSLISRISGILGVLLELVCVPLLQILLMYIVDEKNYCIILKNILLIAIFLVFFVISIVDFIDEVLKLFG